jgi:hypothetical protein
MFLIFPLCVLLVYIVLAALYESWTLPITVILIVPMTLLSAIAGVWITGGDNNVFTQVSFLVLAGLACKNAILIVEFARQRQDAGEDRRTATVEACKQRLRPIVMTSFAFIFGVLPLVYAQGAGAEMRRSLGIAVFSGMLGVTLFGIFLTPVFYVSTLGRRADPAASGIQRPHRAALRNVIVRARVMVLGSVLPLAACAGQKPYRAPETRPAALVNADPALVVQQAYDARWWRQFEDPVLDQLEAAALQSNFDVQVAVARVRQARAVFDDVSLDRYPTVAVGASIDRREQVIPGFTDERIQTSTSRRVRRILGDRPVRPDQGPPSVRRRRRRRRAATLDDVQ